MATLTGRTISSSYTEVLKTTGSGGITSSLDTVQDGDATDSALQLSTAGVKSTGTLEVTGTATLSTSVALATGATVTGINDTDAMSDASATTLATSESIKAYVDTQTHTDTTYTAGDGLDLTGTVFSAEAASLTNPGVVELATAAETNTGTDATRAVTPDGLEDWTGSAQVTTLGTIATGTWNGTAVDGTYVDLEGTELKSTGQTGGSKYLREDGDGTCSWQAVAGGSGEANEFSFKTISVSGQSDVVADTSTDTLTLAAGSNVTITTNAGTDTVTVASADTNTNQLTTFTVSATTDTTATTISQGDDLFFAAGTGITCETTADGTVTIANTVTDTNTTYTAGDGLDLTGTAFSTDIKSNGGLKIDTTELAVDNGIAQYKVATFGAGAADDDFLRIDGTTVEGRSASEVLSDIGAAASGHSHSAITGDFVGTVTGGTGIDSTGATTGTDIDHTLSLDLSELADITGAGDVSGWSAGDLVSAVDASDSNNSKKIKLPAEIGIACSDETTAITAGNTAADTQKASILIPRAMTVTEVKVNLYKKTSSTVTIDVNYHATAPESAATLLNAALSMTSTNLHAATSTFASSATSYSLAENSFVTVDVDAAGTNALGLKVWLLGYWT